MQGATPLLARPQRALVSVHRGRVAPRRRGARGGSAPSVSDVEAMRVALAQAGKLDSQIEVFMDAQHGFFADYRPSYNAKAAAEAWTTSKAWFHKHGVL